MTIRITREQYARDFAKIIKPDPLEIDPVEYCGYKKLMKYKFMVYVPEIYRQVQNTTTLDEIFDQLVAITPAFTRDDVEEVTNRIIGA